MMNCKIARRTALLSLVVILQLAGIAAAQFTQRNSAQFNLKGCEGTSLPCNNTIVSDLGFTPDFEGEGNYLYDSNVNGHIGWTGQFVDDTGWTIEARVRVHTPNANPLVLSGQLSGGDENNLYQINIAKDRMYGTKVLTYDFSEWTTIRMAKAPTEDLVHIWLNEVEVADGPFAPSGPGLTTFNRQTIGDGTSASGGKLLVDYVRSDSTGAFAPGPPLALPGDYDGSGFINDLDYDIWMQDFGSETVLDADGTNDDIVDAADYVIWRHALEVAESGGSFDANNETVPEPTTLVLLAFATGLFALRKRAR